MKATIDFILKTRQPLAYIESQPDMRFQNIDHNPLETIYKYGNDIKDLTIRVPKSTFNEIKKDQPINSKIYDNIYVGESYKK